MEEQAGSFDYRAFIAKHGQGSVSKYEEGKTIYAQGDPADGLFYIVSGSVKVVVNSEHGKVAMIAMLEAGDFFGEGSLDGHLIQTSTIITATKCEIARFNMAAVARALKDDKSFSKTFLMFLLNRNEKLRLDLVAHLFNSSEKRLARIPLTLAHSGLPPKTDFIDVAVNQETLAMMVGTTRPRINQFMNKFRRLGYIEYNGHIKSEIHCRTSSSTIAWKIQGASRTFRCNGAGIRSPSAGILLPNISFRGLFRLGNVSRAFSSIEITSGNSAVVSMLT